MRKYAPKGFSAVEMLLSLLVIGVISALTIPKFMADYHGSTNTPEKASEIQSVQYTAKWKSAYTNISQAGQMILINNSQTFSGLCSSTDCWKEAFKQHLSSIEECSGNVVNKCWHDRNNWKYLNGSSVPTTFGEASGLVLIDGSYVVFAGADSRCANSICGNIYVDINGPNLPNTLGMDIFLLNITNNSIVPYGAGTLSQDCKEGSSYSSNTGFTCAAKYISY